VLFCLRPFETQPQWPRYTRTEPTEATQGAPAASSTRRSDTRDAPPPGSHRSFPPACFIGLSLAFITLQAFPISSVLGARTPSLLRLDIPLRGQGKRPHPAASPYHRCPPFRLFQSLVHRGLSFSLFCTSRFSLSPLLHFAFLFHHLSTPLLVSALGAISRIPASAGLQSHQFLIPSHPHFLRRGFEAARIGVHYIVGH
jgi:hypothetical protein